MATTTKATKQRQATRRSEFEEELEDLDAAVFVSLPPGVCLAIGGRRYDQEGIAANLEELRALFADHAKAKRQHEARLAAWPAVALPARIFAQQVKAALIAYLDEEAIEDSESAADEPFEELGEKVNVHVQAGKLPWVN